MATVLGSCPFLPRFLGCHGGGSRCTAFTTARVNRAVKLRFTWFATVGFIRCFAHPIQRKIELYLLVIYFGMKPVEKFRHNFLFPLENHHLSLAEKAQELR